MVIDPGTALLIATAVSTAAKGTGDYLGAKQGRKAGARRAKEMRRETQAGLYQDALQRSAELEAQRLGSSGRLGKRQMQSMQDTADLLRGAFNI